MVSVPEDIQELIEEFNMLPDEARFISHYDLDISTSALSELTIIILAVAGGLVLLLIIILALVKMGFFRRRSIEEQENEDLKKESISLKEKLGKMRVQQEMLMMKIAEFSERNKAINEKKQRAENEMIDYLNDVLSNFAEL